MILVNLWKTKWLLGRTSVVDRTSVSYMVSVSLRVTFRVRARNIVKLKLMDQGDVTVSIRVD